MIMRKKDFVSPCRRISRIGENLLQIGLWLISLSLLRVGFEVVLRAPYSPGTAAHFLTMVEYILAALACLTCCFYVIERVYRTICNDEKKR